MSVATKNPFALLDDDIDADAPVLPPSSAPIEEPAPAPAPAQSQRSRGGPAARAGKYYSRGGKPQSKDSAPADDSDAQKKFNGPRDAREGREPREPREGHDGREGGRGRGRGGRGGPRGGGAGRGRPFDRHSQTGKIDTDKRIHQSWGGDDGNAEFKTEQAANLDAVVESNNDWGNDPSAAAPAADWATPDPAPAADWSVEPSEPVNIAGWTAGAAEAGPPIEATRDGRPRRDAEEDDNTLTLDQYLAQQKEKADDIPKLENTRKANDGADDVFKGAVPLSKNEDQTAYFVGKAKTAPKPRAKKEEKVFIDIEARFERPDTRGRGRGRGGDRGDRGDRRGGRGGDRRGSDRQYANGSPSVNVDDKNAFPSLS